jgi:nucleoside-diphosphate-sugar epimerase
MKHVLVVGGTGMLANVTLTLLQDGFYVSVIGRFQPRFDRLIADKSNSTFIPVDYHDDQRLRLEVRRAIDQHGNLQMIVAWIHSSAPNALTVILEEAAKTSEEFRLFHVLGSSSNLDAIKETASVPANCLYRQVQLGFMLIAGHARWLTNNEIACGVIEAISEDNLKKIVGVLEPWEKRP